MIKDVFIWGGDLDGQIVSALEDENCTQINIFAGEEWEIRTQWHAVPYYGKLRKFAVNNTVNIIVGCHDTALHKQNYVGPPEAWLHYWPTHWIHHTFHNLRKTEYPIQQTPEKLFLSLNNKGHWHRCMLMDYLEKNNLMQYGDISWHEKNVSYDFKWWKMKRMVLDENYVHTLNSYSTLPQGFSNTFMSLVAEANMKAHFITEKTWMPVFFKRPFLIFGPPGIHNEMAKLGFKMYDEIFDYSFDIIESMEDRCQAIMDILQTLKSKNLIILKEKIQNKLEFNYNLAYKLAHDFNSLGPLVKDLYQRYNTNTEIDSTYHWLKDIKFA